MKRLIALVFLFLLLFRLPASADILFLPADADFYEAHKKDCRHLQRDYYTNGSKGYISTYDQPDGKRLGYIENANRLRIFCTYSIGNTEWGMATFLNNADIETETWVRTEDLYLIYDGISFREDFSAEIKEERGTVPGAEKRIVFCYEYPGAADPDRYTYQPEDPFDYTETYTDPKGKLWGYVSYYRGIRDSWICVDGLSAIQEPFGGDPALLQNNLSAEGFSQETAETQQTLVPPKTPPPFILDPLVLTAILLVLAAIIAALLLLKFCYRSKKNDENILNNKSDRNH